MPPELHLDPRTLLFIGIAWALICAALWLRELLLDFAEQRFSQDALGQGPYGDHPFISSDDLKTLHSLEK